MASKSRVGWLVDRGEVLARVEMRGKYSPGPWEAIRDTPRLLGEQGSYGVYANAAPLGQRMPAECHGVSAKANAELIAAAPDLVEALRNAGEALCRATCFHDPGGEGDEHKPECEAAIAALKKAGAL